MIKDLFIKGVEASIKAGNEREKKAVGTLRAGNTGMMTEDGQVIGSCAAQTYLRKLGIQVKTVDVNKELMFAGGRMNEDHWLSALTESYDGPIACEEEIPISWTTDNGTLVTGRPDIVLLHSDESPKCGIELKQIMSVNSAYGVLIGKEPQLKHLMQAAHYMWQLDCPFELWYTNRNNLDMPGWMEFRQFPRPGEPGSENLNYRYYRSGDINPKTGKPKKHQLTEAEYHSGKFTKTFSQASKIYPFIQGFELKLDNNGDLFYRDAMTDGSEWIESIVNIPDIKRFYNYVAELGPDSQLPPAALNVNAVGKMAGWQFYQYSDLGKLDPFYCQGMNLEIWVEKIKDLAAGSDK